MSIAPRRKTKTTKAAALPAPSTSDAVARAAQMAAEIVAIADDIRGDVAASGKAGAKAKPKQAPSREAIARAKLRIDVRMWLMARLAPQIYGTIATRSAAAPSPPAPEPFQVEMDYSGLEGSGENAATDGRSSAQE
ncbi:MAG: hypothetical protein JNK21_05770 [Rhodospirillaceae bacterium]|nr:hypothetical protein [Rhodospirillaceae bacterium]